jgi:hypothetical protein
MKHNVITSTISNLLLFFFNVTRVNADNNHSLDFDGANDYVNCGNGSSVQITGTALTIEAWIRADAWKTNVWEGGIVVKEGSSSGYMLRCGDNGRVSFAWGNGSTWKEVTSNTVLLTGRWYHLACVYNGTTSKIYVDGKEVVSVSFTGSIATTSNSLWLGSSAANSSRTFNGRIDEVRIWNIARTQPAAELKASELNGNESGLLHTMFDHGFADDNNAEGLHSDIANEQRNIE